MMVKTGTLYVIIVILVAGMLVSGTFAAFYGFQYSQAQARANTYLSELSSVQPTQTPYILLDFGNGTSVWNNDTQVPTGTNAYIATVIIAHGVVNASWYGAPLNEHYVTGIENVQNTATQAWFIWTYNSTAKWQVAEVGADEIPATTGSIVGWTFCNYNSTTYLPSCTP